MRLVQLSRADHGHLRLSTQRIQALASRLHMAPLVASELRRAAATCPVVFAKRAETGEFYPAALMGLEPHENLYWDGAELDAAYVPLTLLRQPFAIGGGDDDAAPGALCIDLASDTITEDGDRRILEEDGRDSPYLSTIQAMLGELAGQQPATRAFVDTALTHGLLTELKLDITFANGATVALNGLYGIDERRLGRALRDLADGAEALTLAAVALSLEHVAGLVRRKNRQLTADAAWLG